MRGSTNPRSSSRAAPDTMAAKRKYSKLTDGLISSAVDFLEGETKVFFNSQVPGLRIRIGKHRRILFYFQEYSIKGYRKCPFVFPWGTESTNAI